MAKTTATRKTERGFTLMELLVVLGIFSMVVTAATDIFLITGRSQRKVFGLERAQADARFTMEALAREIRTGRIDWDYYEGRVAPAVVTLPETELALIDATESTLRFMVSDASNGTSCPDAASTPCLLVSVSGGVPAPMTPKGIKVRQAAFYVAPLQDPDRFDAASGSYASDVQPRVTVVLTLESVAEREGERSVVTAQTTVSSRRYRR